MSNPVNKIVTGNRDVRCNRAGLPNRARVTIHWPAREPFFQIQPSFYLAGEVCSDPLSQIKNQFFIWEKGLARWDNADTEGFECPLNAATLPLK